MNFGAIIIGDEIIRGKRQDKHFAKTVEILAARGLKLSWALYLADDREIITSTLLRTLKTDDIVFSFGGIGATPDDHTRQCAAAALGVELVLHPDAESEIRSRFGGELTPLRLKMGEFPLGASIIPNPYNRIPGFTIGQHHFVPGFPVMAWPMVEWVLDNKYKHLFHQVLESETSITVYGLPESGITPLMTETEARHQRLKSFSLPSVGDDGTRRHIELGVRGFPDEVALAIEDMKKAITAMGGTWEPGPARKI